ncbi:MAG TPA: hypothetical protein VGK67_38370 [Myxococcales bacterium]
MTRRSALLIAFALTVVAALVAAKPPEGSDGKMRALPPRPAESARVAFGREATLKSYELTVRARAGQDPESAVLEILWSGAKSFPSQPRPTEDNGFRKNPKSYPPSGELNSMATVLYRTHRTCDGTLRAQGAHEAVELKGYANYECRSRFHEQCILDGTFDSFYDERCDFAPVTLSVGASIAGGDFVLALDKVEQGVAHLTVRPSVSERYGPLSD